MQKLAEWEYFAADAEILWGQFSYKCRLEKLRINVNYCMFYLQAQGIKCVCDGIILVLYLIGTKFEPCTWNFEKENFIRQFSKMAESAAHCHIANDWTCFVDHKL